MQVHDWVVRAFISVYSLREKKTVINLHAKLYTVKIIIQPLINTFRHFIPQNQSLFEVSFNDKVAK